MTFVKLADSTGASMVHNILWLWLDVCDSLQFISLSARTFNASLGHITCWVEEFRNANLWWGNLGTLMSLPSVVQSNIVSVIHHWSGTCLKDSEKGSHWDWGRAQFLNLRVYDTKMTTITITTSITKQRETKQNKNPLIKLAVLPSHVSFITRNQTLAQNSQFFWPLYYCLCLMLMRYES